MDMEWKRCESMIHDHECDLRVTMDGWVDVPYSDWGDFRRRRAVDISRSNIKQVSTMKSDSQFYIDVWSIKIKN